MSFRKMFLAAFLGGLMAWPWGSRLAAGEVQDPPGERLAFHRRFHLPYLRRTPGNHAVRTADAWRELIAKNTDLYKGPSFDIAVRKNPVDFGKEMVLLASWELPNLQCKLEMGSAEKTEKEVVVKVHAWQDSMVVLPASRPLTLAVVADRSDLAVRFEIVRMPPPERQEESIRRIRAQRGGEVTDEEALEIIRKVSRHLLKPPEAPPEDRR